MYKFFRVYFARFLIAYLRYFRSIVISLGRSSEFHYFPFDTTKPMPLGAESLMGELCEKLDEIHVHYRITDGTVLGLYRDNAFIPHDNDIDVDLLDCGKIDEIERIMSNAGMKLGRKVVHFGKIQQLTYYNDKHIIFDMVFWYGDGDSIVNYSELGYLRKQSIEYFSELGFMSWHGRIYPVPSRLGEWLSMRYGEDWKIPKKVKDDWKLECHDLIKLEE